MNPSKESVWGRWLPHPGNLPTQRGSGGWALGVFGLLIGTYFLLSGVGYVFGIARSPMVGAVAFAVGGGGVGAFFGALFLKAAEGALGGVSIAGLRRSRPVGLLVARASLLLALLVGFGRMLVHIACTADDVFFAAGGSLYEPGFVGPRDWLYDAVGWMETSGHTSSVLAGTMTGLVAFVPALIVFGLLSRYLVGLGTVRTRPAVLAWAGTVAALSLVAGVAWGASQLGLYSVHGASTVWRGLLWTGALSGLAAVLALVAQRRLAIWDHPDRWRDATVTPELRIVFADGSGDRPASEYFRGYAGPVVVMPTAEAAGAVF
ncbi:MAG: hypothetical protein Q8S73_28565, partial [Deltaproteobacteria bacterium]|nr:hypothetical protein [Deltaproteobacteria bacterium]